MRGLRSFAAAVAVTAVVLGSGCKKDAAPAEKPAVTKKAPVVEGPAAESPQQQVETPAPLPKHMLLAKHVRVLLRTAFCSEPGKKAFFITQPGAYAGGTVDPPLPISLEGGQTVHPVDSDSAVCATDDLGIKSCTSVFNVMEGNAAAKKPVHGFSVDTICVPDDPKITAAIQGLATETPDLTEAIKGPIYPDPKE